MSNDDWRAPDAQLRRAARKLEPKLTLTRRSRTLKGYVFVQEKIVAGPMTMREAAQHLATKAKAAGDVVLAAELEALARELKSKDD